MPYSHYRPILKQSNITVGDALAALNPTSHQVWPQMSLTTNPLADYGIYAGGGGLAGASIGALVNALRGESKLKGALIGGGIGAGLGAGAKALGDYMLSDEVAELAKLDRESETEFRWPWKTFPSEKAKAIKEESLLKNIMRSLENASRS